MLYKNILLIDDDPDDAEIFTEAIGSLNKDIVMRSARNPKVILEELKASETLPDLIFLDYNMPLLNGQEVLLQLKSDDHLRQIPVILISSPSEEIMKDLLQRNEIVKYISKPSSYGELIRILNSIL